VVLLNIGKAGRQFTGHSFSGLHQPAVAAGCGAQCAFGIDLRRAGQNDDGHQQVADRVGVDDLRRCDDTGHRNVEACLR